MASYKLSPDAEADLYRIWLYGVEQWGEQEADRYFHAFFAHFERLAEQPLVYPSVDYVRQGYRRSRCGVDHVYYRVVGDCVEIMAILGRQDAQRWL